MSVISALQAMAALNRTRWDPVPVYVAKDGAWWSGPGLTRPEMFKKPLTPGDASFPVRPVPGTPGLLTLEREVEGKLPWARRPLRVEVDLALPVMHGGAGEDGSLQGLFETLDVPFAGSGPLASALAMDKVAAKRWAESHGIPQVPFSAFSESEWAGSEESVMDGLIEEIGFPCIVKPSGLGSSIGIARASTREELDAAIEDAFRYDGRVVVERAVTRLRELNCSVLGTAASARASVLEEPLSGDALLSFRDKYLRGGGRPGKGGAKAPAEGMASLDRQIPAQIPDTLTAEVRELAVRTFRAFGCEGVVRIDFLLDGADDRVYFNEINTMPGSMSFYLWEPTGVAFPDLLDAVLDAGLERHRQRAGRVRTYNVNLLSERDLGGLKGTKK